MGIVSRNLDDRDWNQLVAQAEVHLREKCPGWTDFSPGDPGRVLVELFAYLTDTLIYRLNRLPDKAYIEFLRLMGVQIYPPMAAQVMLRFSRKDGIAPAKPAAPAAPLAGLPVGAAVAAPAAGGQAPAPVAGAPVPDPADAPEPPEPAAVAAKPEAITIKAGTRVTVDGSSAKDAPIFVTLTEVVLAANQQSVDVLAVHADVITAERLGASDGTAGQSFKLRRAPALGADSSGPPLEIGVETTRADVVRAHSRPVGDKWYRIWREVPNFGDTGDDRFIYIADRMTGSITFPPSLLAFDEAARPPAAKALGEIPPSGAEIRAWYGRGGGPAGNVRPGKLTVLKEPIPGVEVTNPDAASGGCDAETLDNAVQRAPQTFFSLNRAVTARDYESMVKSIGGGAVARTKVFAMAEFWSYAQAGMVQVLLVPAVSVPAGGPVTIQTVQDAQAPDLLEKVQTNLLPSVPLGTDVTVDWITYRSVKIKASVVAFDGEDRDRITQLIMQRLNQMISPVATPPAPLWPFEQPLRIGRVYDAIYGVPGVKDVDEVTMFVDEAPTEPVASLAADYFQPSTWYAASGGKLYRSMDDAQGWALVRSLKTDPGESVILVRCHVSKPGYVVALTVKGTPPSSWRIWVSFDCGNTFKSVAAFSQAIRDAAWVLRGSDSSLLLAGDQGLQELSMADRAIPQPLAVAGLVNVGFWSIAVTDDVRGRSAQVAVASQGNQGVYLAPVGADWAFTKIANLPAAVAGAAAVPADIRVVRWQRDGIRQYLWAGEAFVGAVANRGPYRWSGPDRNPDQYPLWQTGSCDGLAVSGNKVFACTRNQGVLWLDTLDPAAKWQHLDSDCGLPRSPGGDLLPIGAVATALSIASSDVVIAGTAQGVFRSNNKGVRYANVSALQSTGTVSLPSTSLFVSGQHEITVSY